MCKSHLVVAALLLAVCGCSPAADNKGANPAESPHAVSKQPADVPTKVEPAQTPAMENAKIPDNVATKQTPGVEMPAVKEATPAANPAEEPAPRKIAIVRRIPRKANPDEAPAKVVLAAPPKMPVLLLSEEHAGTCLVKVGDVLSDVSLPDVDGNSQSLASLRGEKLTVVFFWDTADRHSLQQLEDMGPDVASLFEAQGVEVVGINVWDDIVVAKDAAAKFAPTYPMLFDTKGTFFSQISTGRPPRTLLLDKEGKIVWLDIEYTRTTRRQLQEAILFLLQAAKAPAG